MSAIDTDTPAVIEPTQILGLIESLSRIGNKSVELQRAVNEFVSYDEDIIKIVYMYNYCAPFNKNPRRMSSRQIVYLYKVTTVLCICEC